MQQLGGELRSELKSELNKRRSKCADPVQEQLLLFLSSFLHWEFRDVEKVKV